MLTLDLPIRTYSEANRREHWAVKGRRVKKQRAAVARSLLGQPQVSTPCVVTLTRYGAKLLDDDNLRGAFKAVRDQVAEWLGCDDDPTAPVCWRYDQAVSTGRPKYWVRVKIEEAV